MRPLCEEGVKACLKVTEFFQDRNIDIIFSSLYKRAIYTIMDFTDKVNLEINVVDESRERKIDDLWIEDFDLFEKIIAFA
ncbi:histidine phosphatase family protein [Caloramator australicus]|uniref:histidine phosphatase family protein n=1 Tax=Caloramator australicus TaxID=515264 RepID=UPI000A05F745|nr:histidine phosphatase family protein [Caloramator australicus]